MSITHPFFPNADWIDHDEIGSINNATFFTLRDGVLACADFCHLSKLNRPLWYVGFEATMPVANSADLSPERLSDLGQTRSLLSVGEIPNQYVDAGLISTDIYFEFSPMEINPEGDVMTRFGERETTHYQWAAGFADRPPITFRTFRAK